MNDHRAEKGKGFIVVHRRSSAVPQDQVHKTSPRVTAGQLKRVGDLGNIHDVIARRVKDEDGLTVRVDGDVLLAGHLQLLAAGEMKDERTKWGALDDRLNHLCCHCNSMTYGEKSSRRNLKPATVLVGFAQTSFGVTG
jgi:hypothetical protein